MHESRIPNATQMACSEPRQLACGCLPPIFLLYPFSQISFLVFISLLLFPWPLLVPRGNQSPRGSSVLGLWSTSTALGQWPTFEWNAGFSVIASIGWVGSLSAGLCHLMTVSIPSLPGFLLVNILRMLLEPRRCRRPGEGTKKKTGERKGERRPAPPCPKREKQQKKVYQEKILWNRGKESCPEVSPNRTVLTPTRMFVVLKFFWPSLISFLSLRLPPTPHALPSCLALLKWYYFSSTIVTCWE